MHGYPRDSIYVAARFQIRFGIGATIGHSMMFSQCSASFYLLNKEINLIPRYRSPYPLQDIPLTDTVVVFDRVREEPEAISQGANRRSSQQEHQRGPF